MRSHIWSYLYNHSHTDIPNIWTFPYISAYNFYTGKMHISFGCFVIFSCLFSRFHYSAEYTVIPQWQSHISRIINYICVFIIFLPFYLLFYVWFFQSLYEFCQCGRICSHYCSEWRDVLMTANFQLVLRGTMYT